MTDQATVSGSAGTPTGTVTFTFFTNGTCAPTGTAAGAPTLAGGVATSNSEGPLNAGSYSFQAVYSGDANYNGSTGACEPLTVTANFVAGFTPGYWKNHCAATQKFLPLTMGSFYTVTTCAQASDILSSPGCGGNRLGCMAVMLLAAKLNLAQGDNPCITSTIATAEALLTKYHYVGPSGTYNLSGPDNTLAQSLHDTLSNYASDSVSNC